MMRRWLIVVCLLAVLPVLWPQASQPDTAAAPAAEADLTSSPAPTAAPTPIPTAEPRRSPREKMIALTFDDGPGPGTLRILDALDRAGGRGTFCMVGSRVEQYPSTARRVARQGSEIATHSFSHPNLAKLGPDRLRRELQSSMETIWSITGTVPRILRPPYGSVSEDVCRASRELGLVIANWNIDTLDWKNRDSQAVYRHIVDNARDGAIVLCHDIYPETAAAVERAIDDLSARGYRLVTVSELLESRADGGRAGQIYYAA